MIAQPNSASQPWKCVVSAPGFSPNVMADGIAARTGNCTNINNNSCVKTQCLVPNDYVGWRAGTSAYGLGFESKRIIKLFIVPYGALKGVQANDTIPILRFAAFYVTGWGSQGSGNQDPCTADPPGTPEPDESAQAGEIKGYFVDFVAPGGGDPVTMKCETGSADPCHAVLVR
jgi:hypothetical protein